MKLLVIITCFEAAILLFASYMLEKSMGIKKISKSSDLCYELYALLFGEEDPDNIALKFGYKIEEYYKNCNLTGTDPDAKKVVIFCVFGIFSFLCFLIMGILIHPLLITVGFVLLFWFAVKDYLKLKQRADDMRSQVKKELPQFLDLLVTELEVGLPINSAILIISQKYESLLSNEFISSMNDVKLGAGGWQTALEKVAERYSIDILSDFVLDISISFNKGIRMDEAVERKTKEIKQKHLLDVKEKAGRTENTILLPIALFQFIPMLVFILLPTLMSIRNF